MDKPKQRAEDDDERETEEVASTTRDPKKTNRNVIPRKDRED